MNFGLENGHKGTKKRMEEVLAKISRRNRIIEGMDQTGIDQENE